MRAERQEERSNRGKIRPLVRIRSTAPSLIGGSNKTTIVSNQEVDHPNNSKDIRIQKANKTA